MINNLYNLYTQDGRYGDAFVGPMRFCITETRRIFIDLKRNHNSGLFIQSQRIASIALLTIGVLVAFFPALSGMIVKAFQPKPATVPAVELSKLLGIQPFTKPTEQSSLHSPENKKKDPTEVFNQDMLACIGEFLHPQELINSMTVSKKFCNFMRLPRLWSHFLNSENLRLNGATPWKITCDASPENKEYLEHPYEQLSTYIRMFRYHLQNPTPDCFEYWARTMIGGPLAFANLPKVRLNKLAESLTVTDLKQSLAQISQPLEIKSYSAFNLLNETTDAVMQRQHSIVMGVDTSESLFLAFLVKRIITQKDNNGEEESLILFKDGVQVANGPWKAKQLRLTQLNDLNYLLDLLNGETPNSSLVDGKFRLKGISLVQQT